MRFKLFVRKNLHAQNVSLLCDEIVYRAFVVVVRKEVGNDNGKPVAVANGGRDNAVRDKAVAVENDIVQLVHRARERVLAQKVYGNLFALFVADSVD